MDFTYVNVFQCTSKYLQGLLSTLSTLSTLLSTLHLYKKYLSISTSTQEGILKCP